MKADSENIYLELTREFNQGKTRVIISSGQAVVLHRLAIMSKDGGWIVRENHEDLIFILRVLERRGAVYRFGAPLDARWLAGGWSSHFEFPFNGMRVRCDFFSRPPRLPDNELELLWKCQSERDIPILDGNPAQGKTEPEGEGLRSDRRTRQETSTRATTPVWKKRPGSDRPRGAKSRSCPAVAIREGLALPRAGC